MPRQIASSISSAEAAFAFALTLCAAGCKSGPENIQNSGVQPAQGKGDSATFRLEFVHPRGARWIRTAEFLVNGTMSSFRGCFVHLRVVEQDVLLQSDADPQRFLGPRLLESPEPLKNSQCEVLAAGGNVRTAGYSLVWTLPLRFNQDFAGQKTLYMHAVDVDGVDSGWEERGRWTVGPAVPAR